MLGSSGGLALSQPTPLWPCAPGWIFRRNHPEKHWTAWCFVDRGEILVSGFLSCSVVLLLDFVWGAVAQRRVESFVIVFQLDPGSNIAYGFGPGRIHHLVDPLILQSGIKRLRPGTHPTHPCPARRGEDAVSFEVLGEGLGSVLAAPIGMEYRLPFLAGTVGHCHVDSITDQCGAHVMGHCIPDCFLVQLPKTVAR